MKSPALLLISATAIWAQQPKVENAKFEVRPFAGSLGNQLQQLGPGPYWAGYSEPIIAGRHDPGCCGNGNNCCAGCALETGAQKGGQSATPAAPIRLEGPTALVVLIRIDRGQVDQLRTVSPDCPLDAGGLPFFWIANVPADQSVSWLKLQVTERNADRAILAIALHKDPVADQALEDLTTTTQPEKVREKTAFWLGVTRGPRGVQKLRAMLATDPSDKVRERVVFALCQTRDPDGTAAVVEAAKSDKSPHVRGQALFWLAQKAGEKQAAEVIRNAVLSDPDRQVKERAVFALTQLPGDDGIPVLINLAKTNQDPNVRKKAAFWLGQSKDPRALEFFEQVLK